MPHHPEIVVRMPREADGVIRFSAYVGRHIRLHKGDEIARDYYQEAVWAKHWHQLVEVVKQWVTLER